jgi:CubicO group peptidase (beta-lactamase class C family)
MTKIYTVFCFLCFVFTGVCTVTAFQAPDTTLQHVQTFVQEITQQGLFSGNILIAQREKIIYQQSVGYADWEKKTPLSAETKYNIGSLTKDFTQVLILQLLQEGKLALSHPIGKYISDFPETIAQTVTIEHLLTMRSGMGDYLMEPNFKPERDTTVSQFVQVIRSKPLMFKPGSEQRYSNSGYVVLGAIIEALTGKSYSENVIERIFKPLGMNNSAFLSAGMTAPNMAKGTMLTLSGEKYNERQISSTFHPSPAGGVYSTVGDLLLFSRSMLNDERLLKNASKVLFYGRFSTQAGMTWNELRPKVRRAAAGGLPGWNSVVIELGNLDYTIIVCSNVNDEFQAAEEVGMRLSSIMQNKPLMPMPLPVPMAMYKYIKEQGIEKFITNYKTVLQANDFDVPGPGFFNRFGYALLQKEKKAEWAVEIFKLNTTLFPKNSNMFDSLGEGYMAIGNTKQAIEQYEKAVMLNPNNENAKSKLEALKKK